MNEAGERVGDALPGQRPAEFGAVDRTAEEAATPGFAAGRLLPAIQGIEVAALAGRANAAATTATDGAVATRVWMDTEPPTDKCEPSPRELNSLRNIGG